MRRRLPKFIRVLGQRILITLEDEPVIHELSDEGDHLDSRVYGLFKPEYPGIVLDRATGPERTKVTLVHESLHAMVNTSKFEFKNSDKEEELVGRLAPVLLDFIRSNVGVILYLQES